jgi:hypothetical protein
MWLSVLQNNQLRKRYYLRMLRYGQMRRILEETDVLVKNGKISAIGKIFQTLLLCSDAKGKHLPAVLLMNIRISLFQMV